MAIGEDLTYESYIETWEGNYGEATTGEYGYWKGYKHFPYQVHRLSLKEFEKHREGLMKANEDFQIALAVNDDDKMGEALASSMPHELALLL